MPPVQPNLPPDFLASNGKPGFKLPGSNANPMQKKIMMVAGLIFGLIAFIFLFSLIFSGGSETKDAYFKVAQLQTEIVRVSEFIEKETANQGLKNLAANTRLTVASQQSDFTKLIGSKGISFKEKEIKAGKNTKTDASLNDAKAAGLFEETAINTLKEHVTAYQNAISDAYDISKNEEIKELLQQDHEETKLLQQSAEKTRP
jgi:hypothetical protein